MHQSFKDKRYKLSDEDIIDILDQDRERHLIRERAKLLTVDAICARYGISHSYYYSIINADNRTELVMKERTA
jgi:hypothetical protein